MINQLGKEKRKTFLKKNNNKHDYSVTYELPKLPESFVFSTQLLKGVKIANCLGYEDVQLATFEKIDNRHKYQNNRGWTPQINHMEEYREHQNQRYSNRGYGGQYGYDNGYNNYNDRGYNNDRRGGYQNRNNQRRGGGYSGNYGGGYGNQGNRGGYGGGGYGGSIKY